MELTGQRFGLLSVMGKGEPLGSRPTWRVHCLCGGERTVREDHLRSAEASGIERERLLARSATGYEQVLRLGGNDRPLCASALRSLANVRAEQGRLDEAERYFIEAVEMNVRMGARPYLVRTQRAYSNMLLDRDSPGDRHGPP